MGQWAAATKESRDLAFKIKQIFAVLAAAQVQYVVVGGFAVIMHGHRRSTADLDLVVGLDRENCLRALDALAGIGLRPRLPVSMIDFADPAIRSDWFEQRNMLVFQLWDPDNPERSVDLFLREPIGIADLLSEAIIQDLEGVPIPVASIRHLISMKREAGRRTDLDDVEALREIARVTGQREV